MPADVTEVHLQDLADVLEAKYSPEEIADAARRFESDDVIADVSGKPRIVETLRGIAEDETFDSVFAFLLDERDWSADQLSDIREALEGSPFSVRQSAEGEATVFKQVPSVADRSVLSREEEFEDIVPTVIQTQIDAASEYLGGGEYDLAAAEIRRAMDMLVIAGFEEAMEELAENELLQLGDEHEHSDATMLYVAYGYCSFLGGNPEVKGFETSKQQAELAFVLGQEAIYFMLRTLEKAEAKGIELNHWERP